MIRTRIYRNTLLRGHLTLRQVLRYLLETANDIVASLPAIRTCRRVSPRTKRLPSRRIFHSASAPAALLHSSFSILPSRFAKSVDGSVYERESLRPGISIPFNAPALPAFASPFSHSALRRVECGRTCQEVRCLAPLFDIRATFTCRYIYKRKERRTISRGYALTVTASARSHEKERRGIARLHPSYVNLAPDF